MNQPAKQLTIQNNKIYMNSKHLSLVSMSGQFWKITVQEGSVILISTIKGFRTRLSFESFINKVVNGSIQPCE